ncbi:MAG: hypothetical protein KIS75_09220 [Chromatiales bacterium]|nr:hypothetical protein [Chromatiales bacterium]
MSRSSAKRAGFGPLPLCLLAALLAAPAPALALSGTDLVADVCVATLPQFDDAAGRMAAYRPRAISYDGRLFEQVDASRRSSWTLNEAADAADERFLVSIAWGTFQSQPAASCLVIDKKGIPLGELESRLGFTQIRVRPGEVLYTTVADAIASGDGGRQLWLTLILAPAQNSIDDATVVGAVTLMSSNYLNTLMEKGR